MGAPDFRTPPPTGEVVEWLMALVLKTSEVRASVGSNPTLSVLKSPVSDWVFKCPAVLAANGGTGICRCMSVLIKPTD